MGLKLAFQFADNIDFQCFVSQEDSLKVVVEMKVKSKYFSYFDLMIIGLSKNYISVFCSFNLNIDS